MIDVYEALKESEKARNNEEITPHHNEIESDLIG
jgi:hypothetical protein